MIETGIGVVLRQCMVVPVVQPMEHRHAFTFVPDQAEAMVEASMEPKVAAIRYPVHVGYALTSLGCPVLTWYQTTCDIRYWRTLRCYQAHVFAVRLGRLVLTWGMRLPGVGKGAALPVCRGTRVPPRYPGTMPTKPNLRTNVAVPLVLTGRFLVYDGAVYYGTMVRERYEMPGIDVVE